MLRSCHNRDVRVSGVTLKFIWVDLGSRYFGCVCIHHLFIMYILGISTSWYIYNFKLSTICIFAILCYMYFSSLVYIISFSLHLKSVCFIFKTLLSLLNDLYFFQFPFALVDVELDCVPSKFLFFLYLVAFWCLVGKAPSTIDSSHINLF